MRKPIIANRCGYQGGVAELRDILDFASHALQTNAPVSLALVDDDTIRSLNLRFKGKDDTTDVLAFALDRDGGFDPDPELGEIVVSVDTAKRQAKEAGHDPGRELALLSLHGLLHLAGMDDRKARDRKAMLDRGEELLSAFETLRSARKALGIAGKEKRRKTRRL